MNAYIQDYYGNQLDLLNPDPVLIDWNVTATCLSRIPRFNGHTTQAFPVLAHILCVIKVLNHLGANTQTKMWGLHHDDAEAYIHDISSPLKNCGLMQPYKEIEGKFNRAILEKLGLDLGAVDFVLVKYADLVSVVCEADMQMEDTDFKREWTDRVKRELIRLLPEIDMHDILFVCSNEILHLLDPMYNISNYCYNQYIDLHDEYEKTIEEERNPA